MDKKLRISDLFETVPPLFTPLFEGVEYPWELLSRIEPFCKELLGKEIEGYRLIATGVLVGEEVEISRKATILPPAIIGKGTQIRPGAYLRGNVVVGENCVIGNSTELKNCILFPSVQVPHYNYVGDSVLGKGAHMGAGAICSNLKSDGKNVFIRGEKDFPTFRRKVGAFLGDGADIGCGCVLNPGTVVGKNTSVYPLLSLRGVYPAGCIVKSVAEIVERKEKTDT